MNEPMTAAFHTLGCKVNSYETEAVAEMMADHGYRRVSFTDKADVYVINSCMVTTAAEAKTRQYVRKPHRLNPDAIVVVMGCLSQLKASRLMRIPGVKIVVGTKNRERIPALIDAYKRDGEPINTVSALKRDDVYDTLRINDFSHHQRAFLKIEDGCDNFCTYCIIPHTRGRVRSKPLDAVLAEARDLVASGHIEIILTGIHTGAYGKDLNDVLFSDLLAALSTIDGLVNIRLSSIEVNELTDDVLDVLSDHDVFVPHLHIPLQSGSDRILKKMNRHYTTAEYESTVQNIRDRLGDVAITTDVITGFPSETDDDFETMKSFIERMGFQDLHVFPFSPREGTPAATMDDQVHDAVKKARVKSLLSLSKKMHLDYIRNHMDDIRRVVVERRRGADLMGHTRDYIHVRFKGDESLIGQQVPVRIVEPGAGTSRAVLAK
jgi:threonylcarbamoyladenosine tRNA methylthiotransferase MtaB